MPLLERQRLVGYPRLLLGCFALVILANALLGEGWMGGLGQFIGVDFVTLYAAGWLYRFDPGHLYDALLHDLLILFPAFLLLAHHRRRSRALLRSAVATYCGATLLPMLGSPLGVALVALVPIAFLVANRDAFAWREPAPGAGVAAA